MHRRFSSPGWSNSHVRNVECAAEHATAADFWWRESLSNVAGAGTVLLVVKEAWSQSEEVQQAYPSQLLRELPAGMRVM